MDIFRQNRPIRYGDIEIFRFFYDGGRPPSWICLGVYLDHSGILGGLYYSANFGYNRLTSFDNMRVSKFGAFGRKTPVHAPKIAFGDLTPKWKKYQRNPQKAHLFVSPRYSNHRA